MMKNTNTQKVPSTRAESIDMLIREFLESDKKTINLVLCPTEIPKLEEEYKDIYIHRYKNLHYPQSEFFIFTVYKRKDLQE